METVNWKITVTLHNERHEVVGRISIPEASIPENTVVKHYILPHVRNTMIELKWKGFEMWAQHEALDNLTQFCDINYLRKADGTLNVDCENHHCSYRAILTPVVFEDECVICTNEMKSGEQKFLSCMHGCVCEDCFTKIDRCPICRKRKVKSC